jgi:DNA-directed RNA polymerase subunit M/transcription elongation factor TFIIS
MILELRTKGKNTLATVINKPQNVKVIENAIFNRSLAQSEKEDKSKEEDDRGDDLKTLLENMYSLNVYQIVGDILQDETTLKSTLLNIKSDKFNWDQPSYKEMRLRLQEQDDFIENPFVVEEGIFECKCGSKRVFSYTKQCRSSDEPESVFAQCMACDTRWVYSG